MIFDIGQKMLARARGGGDCGRRRRNYVSNRGIHWDPLERGRDLTVPFERLDWVTDRTASVF